MADNLARFERLSRQAHERSAARRAAELAEAQAAHELWLATAEESSRRSRAYLAGPPGGCHKCWEWRAHPTLGPLYNWWHGDPMVHEVRPWPVDEPGYPSAPTDYCMHDCHGPDGHPLPVIAYA